MAPLILKVHDVGLGTYLYVQAPNGKKVVIDCGSGDYSPSEVINTTSRRKTLDYLIISHPHMDHIDDILQLRAKFKVEMLRINRAITMEKIKKLNTDDDFDPDNDEHLLAYYKYARDLNNTVSWDESPRNPKWGCGCTFHCYHAGGSDLKINDMSVTVFIEFGEHVVFYGGDIEKEGWEHLLKNNDFRKFLAKTTIFIAPHHGNDSGYNTDAFDRCSPQIIIMSTDSSDDTVVSKYARWSKGLRINRPDGETEDRNVLTTRNDGCIKIVFHKGKKPKITVEK